MRDGFAIKRLAELVFSVNEEDDPVQLLTDCVCKPSSNNAKFSSRESLSMKRPSCQDLGTVSSDSIATSVSFHLT